MKHLQANIKVYVNLKSFNKQGFLIQYNSMPTHYSFNLVPNYMYMVTKKNSVVLRFNTSLNLTNIIAFLLRNIQYLTNVSFHYLQQACETKRDGQTVADHLVVMLHLTSFLKHEYLNYRTPTCVVKSTSDYHAKVMIMRVNMVRTYLDGQLITKLRN
jgi:hypothetical protein